MNYLSNLCKTYDALLDAYNHDSVEFRNHPLLPLYHDEIRCVAEITIDKNGKYIDSRLLEKDESTTIVPCMPNSLARSSGIAPHALFDTLSYMCKGLNSHIGESDSEETPDNTENKKGKTKKAKTVKKTTEKRADEKYEKYLEQLIEWDCSENSHWAVHAIRLYVESGTMLDDLLDNNLMVLDQNGFIMRSYPKEAKIKATPLTNENPIRIRVIDYDNDYESEPWKMKDVQQAHVNRCISMSDETQKEICYITGEEDIPCETAVRNIRHPGDDCKLLSSNDSKNFTYRGPRAKKPSDACVVGTNAMFKSHNALKWLIKNQRCKLPTGVTYVLWNSNTVQKIPDISNDTDDLFSIINMQDDVYNSKSARAQVIQQAIMGYLSHSANLTQKEMNDQITILGVDDATGKGRLAAIYYQEYSCDEFARKLAKWHSDGSWTQIKRVYNEDKTSKLVSYIGMPSINTIIKTGYEHHDEVSPKHYNMLVRRLLPCILDESPVPIDIINTLTERATHPLGQTSEQHRIAVNTACSLIKKHYCEKGVNYSMSVEHNSTDPNYLFGRLLAYYQWFESAYLFEKNIKRDTNATRYMATFRQRPATTAELLNRNLRICEKSMSVGAKTKYRKDTTEIINSLGNNFADRNLSPLYLLGYSSQLSELYGNAKKNL